MAAHPGEGDQNGTGADDRAKAWFNSPLSVLRRPFSLFHLPLPFSERRLLLTGLDLLAVNGALLLILALRSDQGLVWQLLSRHPFRFLLLNVLWLPIAHAFDAYDLRVSSRFSTAAPAVTRAGLLTGVIYYLLNPTLMPALPSRFLSILALPFLSTAFLLAGRGLYVLSLFQPLFHCRALIVGAGWAGRTIAQLLTEHGGGMYWLVGFVDDDPVKQGAAVEARERSEGEARVEAGGGEAQDVLGAHTVGTLASLHVIGDRHALKSLIAEQRVTTLVLAITHEVNGELLQILMDCLELGVEIIAMPVLYEQLTGRVPVEHVGGNWYVAMPVHHPGTGTMWPVIKRLTDVVLASLGLLLLGMATPVIAAAIYLDSPGPIFYAQERVGKGGRRFQAYKFRSMVPDAEKGEAIWAREDDQRATRVGRFLRKTHVDEFPQFLNILKGEMSAVGPRPERPEFVEELAQEIPFFRVRHAARPGMAGWALVNQGYGSSREAAVIKLQYDLYYIKHQSLWLDLVILLKTVVDSFALRGR